MYLNLLFSSLASILLKSRTIRLSIALPLVLASWVPLASGGILFNVDFEGDTLGQVPPMGGVPETFPGNQISGRTEDNASKPALTVLDAGLFSSNHLLFDGNDRNIPAMYLTWSDQSTNLVESGTLTVSTRINIQDIPTGQNLQFGILRPEAGSENQTLARLVFSATNSNVQIGGSTVSGQGASTNIGTYTTDTILNITWTLDWDSGIQQVVIPELDIHYISSGVQNFYNEHTAYSLRVATPVNDSGVVVGFDRFLIEASAIPEPKYVTLALFVGLSVLFGGRRLTKRG